MYNNADFNACVTLQVRRQRRETISVDGVGQPKLVAGTAVNAGRHVPVDVLVGHARRTVVDGRWQQRHQRQHDRYD